MISAAPLYSGVHNWTGADHVRMCGINEDRRTPLSDEESKASSSQHLGSEDRCVSSVLSKVGKVDFIPATNQSDALMLREDGGAEVEAVQKLEEKPPDPTIFVSDSVDTPAVTPENCIGISVPEKKQLANMLDISVQGPPSADSKIMESARTPAPEKAAEAGPTFQPADGDHSVKQRTVLTADLQIAGQPVEASRTVVTSSFGTLTPFTMSGICFSATQVPSVQKLPLSFPPGAVLTPTQPLVYIPPPNCGQSLSVTTLPTTFGVTSTLTLPMLQSCLQDRCLPSIITPTELHSQAFVASTSSVARPLAADSKVVSTELNKPTSTTSSTPPTNNNITTAVDVTAISSNASSSVLSSHPTLPVVINPVTLASYTRTSSNLESQSEAASSSISPLKSPPQLEREIVSPQDSCDMPLDLSSKSHRQKHTPPNQRKTPPMPVLTPVHTSGKASLSTVLSRSDCSSQRSTQNSFTSSSVTQNNRAVPPLVMFPEFLRNGDPGSAQLLGAPGSWIKNSAAFISTIPGTYVGVANPVPASMLLNKDSNMSLSKDSRHLAKQEPISIIDQGDPKNSGSCSKKGTQTSADVQQPTANRYLQSHVTSVTSLCPPKDWSLHGHGSVHPKCPLNGKPSNAQVLPVSWSPYQQASLLSIGISATGTLHSNQAPPHRLPIGEYTLFPNILPAEPTATPQKTVGETPDAQQKNTVASVPEHDLVAKGRTCETVSKSRKSNANKALLAPKPAAGNSVLYIQPVLAEPAESGTDSIKGANATLKSQDKTNCKEEKIHPKFPCPRKSFGDSKPKNKVLATYMTNEQPLVSQQKDCLSLLDQNCSKNGSRLDAPQDTSACSKKSRKKGQNVDSQHCVQEVDLSKVKIERVDDDENFGCISSYENPPWSPVDLPAISKVKTRIKKEPGLRCRSKRLEEVSTITPLPQRSKSRTKQRDEDVTKASQEPNRRKWRRQAKITEAVPEKKVGKITATEKESNRVRPKRKRRRSIKHEPFDPEFDRDIPEKKPKNSFRDFIPVVLKSRTRSQKGNAGSSDNMAASPGVFSEEEEDMEVPCKRRKPRNIYKDCPYRKYTLPKEEPQSMPITPVLRGSWELSRVKDTGKPWAPLAVEDEKNEDGSLLRRKRRRQKNRKYQNGEYLTEKEEEEVSQCYRRRKARSDFRKRKSSLSDRDIDALKNKLPPSSRESQKQGESRNGLNKSRPDESPTSLTQDKPSGKRKCKTKHIGGSTDEDTKGKVRRTSQSPKSSPVKSPSSRKCADPVTPQRSRRTSTLGSSDTPSAQHIPPEARRLIVNKNAGETLLQRAARLGYKDVVLYCLQRDLGDINHRDNAGYTALHEACARGWTEILQILLDNGANVNCSAQDGTRPIHDAVVNDNLETVWLLLSYGADPTLATYSGQTPMKLASSEVMRTYLSDYLSDLRGRSDGDPRAAWDFYSSSILGGKDEIGNDVLLDSSEKNEEEEEGDKDLEDNFMFEFSDKPLISCYNLHVSLTSGPGNWFLFSEVLKKLKLSSRIFQARYPKFEIASMQKKEFTRQVCTSQILTSSEGMDLWPQDVGEMVELVRYEPELLQLLGSSVEFQCVNS